MKACTNWRWAALLLVLGVVGCSGSGLVSATGKLTYKGQPVPSTLVIFMPEDGSRRSTGLTDDEGNFSLRFSRTETGVKPGRHTICLRYEVSAEEETHQIPPKASKELRSVISRYGDPKTSTLHQEVTRGGQYFDIQLE
jgi:hypothetical protein